MVYLNFQVDIDDQIPTNQYEAMMERGLSYTAAIIREANYMGYRAGFEANCVLVTGEKKIQFPLGAGDLHLKEILKEMAKIRTSVGVSYMSLLEAAVHEDYSDIEVVLITPYINDEIEDRIVDFQAKGNHVALIKLTPEEKE